MILCHGEVAVEAAKYLNPLFYASPVIACNYAFSGLVFGLGYVKFYTIMTIVPIFVSIAVLSPITIMWLNLGTYGAALA